MLITNSMKQTPSTAAYSNLKPLMEPEDSLPCL